MVDPISTWPAGEPVPAITLRQPWASAVAFFGKDVENRTNWRFKHRGPLIIHAGKATADSDDLRRFLELAREDGATDQDLEGISPDSYPENLFPHGCLLAVVNLADVFGPEDKIPEDHPVTESPWASEDATHWLYIDEARVVKPVPFTGALGLFKVPYEVAARLEVFPVASA